MFHPPRTSLGFADLILGAPPRKPTHTATGPVSPAMCATGLADERLESGAEVGPGYLGVATFDGTVQARFDVVGEDDLRCGIEGSAHGRDLSQELGALPPGLGHASHGLQMTGRAGEPPGDVVPVRVRVQLGRGCVVGVAVVPMRMVGGHGSIGGNTRARTWSLHPGHPSDCSRGHSVVPDQSAKDPAACRGARRWIEGTGRLGGA